MRSCLAIFIFSFLLTAPLRAQTNPFESDIRAFEQADLQNPPPANSILFLGSSTIVRWDSLENAFPQFNVLNRGFGGSQASDVLFFYDRLVPPYRSPLVVFYEGDNDLSGGKSVDRVFADWTNFVSRVHRDLPGSHIMFVSVKPSPSRASLLPVQRALNDKIRAHVSTDPRLLYADVFTALLTPSGQTRPELYVSDQLHLNPAGYAVWESVLVPAIENWAKRYPIEVRKHETGTILIDFGADNLLSSGAAQTAEHWNNITTVGSSSAGSLSNLLTTRAVASPLALQMVSRFNGANENGTAASPVYPASATRDSLFGNTETFSGLANIFPKFNLAGLDPDGSYRLVFYASRMSVSDNRETRYTVSGSATNFTSLNAANNVTNTAEIVAQPDSSGALSIALSPGPNNNNANHFTYLGVLRIESQHAPGMSWLLDFGSGSSVTGTQEGSGPAWNDLPASIGMTDSGSVFNLVTTSGTATTASLSMLSRFNGANSNGATNSTLFPPSASQDSLFGNAEAFGGLANASPAFKLKGLLPRGSYRLEFYASRAGVGDNRETTYSVFGVSGRSVTLNAANNVNMTAVLEGVVPDASGELQVHLTPGPGNNNANHFTYLGVLRLDWSVAPWRAESFTQARVESGHFKFRITGDPGMLHRLEASSDLKSWQSVGTFFAEGDLPMKSGWHFFRLAEP